MWKILYIYILIAFLCDFLIDSLLGLNSSNKERPARIFPFRAKIRDHSLLYDFIHFSSLLFGGLFLYIFEGKYKSKNKGEISIEDYEKIKKNILGDNKSESIKFNLIIIGLLYSFAFFLQDFISLTHIDLSLWTLEILYISLISYWIFKNKIYRHKKFAIYIMVLFTIVRIIEYFIPTTKHVKKENINELIDVGDFKAAIIKYGAYSIPLFLMATEIKHFTRDYYWIKMKYLMDIKSITPYKILFIIGGIGIFILIIFFSIFTYVPCKTFNNINKIGDNYSYNNSNKSLDFNLEYCSLKDYDENTKSLYLLYDSIKVISSEYSNTDKNNMLEIFLLIPLFFIFNTINEISRIILIRHFEPNVLLIYKYFYYFVRRIIQIIINEGDEQYIRYDKFIVLELEQIGAIMSGLIYIEIIELKFCQLNYELKKNIDRRGTKDTIEGFILTESESEFEEIELRNKENANEI